MKNRVLLILLLSFAVSLAASAQKITMNLQQVKLEKVFSLITKQTGLTVAYSRTIVNPERIVSVQAKDKDLSKVLDDLFAGTNVAYEIGEKKIYLKAKEAPVASQGSQKTKKITGTVTDTKGEPVIGATVKEQGTTNGTITDFDGNFKLTVKEGSSLFVSYVGYQDKSVKAVIGKDILVTLLEDTEMLEEVVVVGYGTQKKVNLTGAVESVELSKAKGRAYTNVSSMLQGNVAGAFISQTSGQPGNDGATIQIRGIGTFNNTSPLVIIDGMEGNLDAVNPKDIESVSVLTSLQAA